MKEMADAVHRSQRRCLVRVTCVAVLLVPILANATAREWFTLSIDGQRVGYAYRDIEKTKEGSVAIQYSRVAVMEFRKSSLVEKTIRVSRDLKGAAAKVEVRTAVGNQQDSWLGTIDHGGGKMVRRISSVGRDEVVSFSTSTIMPDERYDVLSPLWTGSALKLGYQYLDPSVALPIHIDAEVVAGVATNDAADSAATVHIRRTISQTSSSTEDLWFDRNGRLLKLQQLFYGATLQWNPCAMECDASVAVPFDLMARLVVRSPFHVPLSALRGPIRYVIATDTGAPPTIPTTTEQSVVFDNGKAIVTVCNDCGSEPAAAGRDVAQYLLSNAWVQSDNSEIKSFAHRSSGYGSSKQKMDRLVVAVRAHINGPIDYLSYGTALDALRHRSGDCTEFASLLTAAARAEGIPARIAIGIVFADRFSGKKDVFSPHAWVQAWDGERWRSYDAALDGFDATHIAMAIGDGRPEQFSNAFGALPRWHIEKLGLIHR
jgi:hypothetical protein